MGIDIRRTRTLRDRIIADVQQLGYPDGRIVDGIINQTWPTTERTIPAGTLGLKSLTNVQLTPGTTLNIHAHARVVVPGSASNSVRIMTYMTQTGLIRIGTPRYTVFSPSFTATPIITMGIGSPTARTIGTYEPRITRMRPGSFATVGSPTWANNSYSATGQGSYPINFIAIGQ